MTAESVESGERPDQSQLFIPVVCGSVRKNRRSYGACELIAQRVEATGHRTELIDLRALALPMYDEEPESEIMPGVAQLREIMGESDASIWQSPEYNHSFTSAVKNAIDYLDEELRRKPVAVAGLGSLSGGTRAVEHLKLVLIELHALPTRDSVAFTDARNMFDAEGKLQRPEWIGRIDLMVRELAWYARALKWGREHVEIPERR
ncbi:MAG TPA: NAD(P)H-dependent oxidoreductase [Chloroflexota bacterium]|nr:NAD(P)H-dependent oxidoreductase [Chloroflexota bacterium]